MTVFIKIDLKDEVELDEAASIAREIINILDDVDKISDQITEVSLGGERVVWISDEENDKHGK